MKAIPALLTPSIHELKSQIDLFAPYFSHYQIDICDGVFVPNTTVSLQAIADAIVGWDTKPVQSKIFDFDLMLTDYETALSTIDIIATTLPVQTIFLHASSIAPRPLPTRSAYAIGIAIDPKDSIEDLARHYDIKSLPALQIMTVVPGFQGSPFVANMLQKIDQLRHYGYRNAIYIDGSVNAETIPLIKNREQRPDILGIGSFLTKAPNVAERVREIHALLDE